jgi:hypothetical protein
MARLGRVRTIGPLLAVVAASVLIGAVLLSPKGSGAPTDSPGAAISGAASGSGSPSSASATSGSIGAAVPAEFAGQRVYGSADAAAFPTSGSFLLGGLVTVPDKAPPCAQRAGVSAAEMHLLAYCAGGSIDRTGVAPKSASLAAYRDLVVVARVHIDDPEAAQCPAATRRDCESAVVVEEVLWASGTPAVSTGPRLPSAIPAPASP